MPPETLITLYVALALGALVCLCVYTERRRKRFTAHFAADHIFRCRKCSYVYTDDDDVDLSRCPTCGTMNEEIKF
jgi:predicted Zn-ribbon and HTH transcriptional regulator